MHSVFIRQNGWCHWLVGWSWCAHWFFHSISSPILYLLLNTSNTIFVILFSLGTYIVQMKQYWFVVNDKLLISITGFMWFMWNYSFYTCLDLPEVYVSYTKDINSNNTNRTAWISSRKTKTERIDLNTTFPDDSCPMLLFVFHWIIHNWWSHDIRFVKYYLLISLSALFIRSFLTLPMHVTYNYVYIENTSTCMLVNFSLCCYCLYRLCFCFVIL